jgi:hypothetical protein
MLGTAGIGYFYLRLYDRHNTPPVIILPVHAHQRAQTFAAI